MSEYQRQIIEQFGSVKTYRDCNGRWPDIPEPLTECMQAAKDSFYLNKFNAQFGADDATFLECCGKSVDALEKLNMTSEVFDAMWSQLLDAHQDLQKRLYPEREQ
jgi:hypothetical protein